MGQYGYAGGSSFDGTEDDGDDRNEIGTPLFDVDLCSGETIKVQTEQEMRWFIETRDKYLAENKFELVTDYQDIDRLLVLELGIFRWTQHLASGFDYQRNLVDEELLRKQIKESSDAINKLKMQLGLDKKAREAALSEGNFHVWFADVKRRAKVFGVHRENQLREGLSLMNELSGIVGTYDRSDEEERKKVGFATEHDILEWVRNYMLPKYHEVDAYFIEHEQKLWKRDL